MNSGWQRSARSVRDWIGGQPAAVVLAGIIALALIAKFTVSEDTLFVLGFALPAVFALYCALRPSQRLDAFFISCAPASASAIGADILGISRGWIAWPVLAVTLAVLWDLDRTPRTPEPQPGV